MEHLAAHPKASAADRALYARRLRLAAYEAWAQAAMNAEDLEILLTGLAQWRSGQDLFASLMEVKAEGPIYFGDLRGPWTKRLPTIIRFPTKSDLEQGLSPAEAVLLDGGLANSIREASDDLYALESLIPWDIRDSMLRYKHGFTWLVPAVAPMRTDSIGLRRLGAAPASAFAVWTGHERGALFEGSEAGLGEAMTALKIASELQRFICAAILTETESPAGVWGVALYGDTADDVAQRDVAAKAVELVNS